MKVIVAIHPKHQSVFSFCSRVQANVVGIITKQNKLQVLPGQFVCHSSIMVQVLNDDMSSPVRWKFSHVPLKQMKHLC